jgi:hypothetical protein
MKTLILLVASLILVAATPVYSYPVGLIVLSESYHIEGYSQGNDDSDSYNLSDTSPISQTVTSTVQADEGIRTVFAHSAGELFKVEANARGTIDNIYWKQYLACAIVDATWTFKPTTSALDMCISTYADIYQWDSPPATKEWWLIDITTQEEIARDPHLYPMSYGTVEFDPTHTYELNVHIDTGTSAGVEWFGKMNVLLTPEPSTLLLLGLGVPILAGLRTRRG